jgi:hypothetical protein
MSKTIYRYYSKADFRRTGVSFTSLLTEDDDYKPSYPYTDVPVPEELQSPDKVAFFVPETQTWTDMSADAQILADKQATADLAQAKADAAAAKAAADDHAATIADLQTQLTEAQDAIVEVAQAALPSTDTTADDTTTPASGSDATTTAPAEGGTAE